MGNEFLSPRERRISNACSMIFFVSLLSQTASMCCASYTGGTAFAGKVEGGLYFWGLIEEVSAASSTRQSASKPFSLINAPKGGASFSSRF